MVIEKRKDKKKGSESMQSWSCNQQVCASCRYWCGKREIDFMAYFFEVLEDEGKCANPAGGFRGVKMNGGSSCCDWKAFKER